MFLKSLYLFKAISLFFFAAAKFHLECRITNIQKYMSTIMQGFMSTTVQHKYMST